MSVTRAWAAKSPTLPEPERSRVLRRVRHALTTGDTDAALKAIRAAKMDPAL
jgi:hypothetical protein